ncbi:hypothetical protein QW060_19630 [Myroides ceti]|uniref:Uncharacterized protein n=1 Tax=Paenimyroides ceti TaxID=395087 RepID=A0ABT8D1Q2_9FLAO|nr:hypothetical protein [Paenimyroides ceti]MDN3709237.1 hypothetical protein [Paenimyroides ceti]
MDGISAGGVRVAVAVLVVIALMRTASGLGHVPKISADTAKY